MADEVMTTESTGVSSIVETGGQVLDFISGLGIIDPGKLEFLQDAKDFIAQFNLETVTDWWKDLRETDGVFDNIKENATELIGVVASTVKNGLSAESVHDGIEQFVSIATAEEEPDMINAKFSVTSDYDNVFNKTDKTQQASVYQTSEPEATNDEPEMDV